MAYGVQLGTKYTLIGGPREDIILAGNPAVVRATEAYNPRFKNWDTGAYPPDWTPYDNGGAGSHTWSRAGFDGPNGMHGWRVNGTGATAAKGFRTNQSHSVAIGDSWYQVFYWKGSHLPEYAANHTYTGTWIERPAVSASVYQRYIHRSVATGTSVQTVQHHLYPSAPGMPTGAYDVYVSGWTFYRGATNLGFVTEVTPGYKQLGTPYASLIVQDGTRAVLNDTADPDFIGYAAEVTGLEGADVRENSIDNIEADGAIHGEFYQSRRPVTITAAIGGNITPTTRNARQQRWTAASRALRTRGVAHRPAVLRWQPDGAPEEMFTTLRRQQRPTITGLQLKEASVAMVAADPRIYGDPNKFAAFIPSGSGTAGRSYDRSYNINFNWAPQRGSFGVYNAGDADTPVLIDLVNTMATVAIQNLTTEEEISINGGIIDGQTMTLDTSAKTIVLQDGTNLFDRIELPRTRWWGLAPGWNTISFLADSFGANARVYMWWRSAWA